MISTGTLKWGTRSDLIGERKHLLLMIRSVVDSLLELPPPPPPLLSAAFDLAPAEPEDPVALAELALAVDELVALAPTDGPAVELAEAVAPLADCVTDDIAVCVELLGWQERTQVQRVLRVDSGDKVRCCDHKHAVR